MKYRDGRVQKFHVVDEKFQEADFFFERFASPKESTQERRFFLSAFASAARSVTFCVKWAMTGIPGFDEWYEPWQRRFRDNPAARYFQGLRNETQKRGSNPAYRWLFDDDTATDELFAFHMYGEPDAPAPTSDLASAAREYMRLIAELLFEAYSKFGHFIDRDVAWTVEGAARAGITVDEITRQAHGIVYGRGSDEERLARARRNDFGSQIDGLLLKWLGHDRFGSPAARASRPGSAMRGSRTRR